ncbi:MAG: class GN sortase [Acidobacteria bacterium]|nr:class GN sortase [Acidobacteriota bacterium]
MNRRVIRITTLILVGIGIAFFGKGVWFFGKAQFAQILLKRAWRQTIEERRDTKPWGWADTHPVARMIIPRLDEEHIVLEGCSGNALAFGPGHMTGTPLPGGFGNSVISGHRDTNFAFLQDLKLGDEIQIETMDGAVVSYSVINMLVTDKHDTSVTRQMPGRYLTLITCYPFNSPTAGGNIRYVVFLSCRI